MHIKNSIWAANRTQVTYSNFPPPPILPVYLCWVYYFRYFKGKPFQRLDFLKVAGEHHDYSKDKCKNTDSHFIFISSFPHQKCTWECNNYSTPGYIPANFHYCNPWTLIKESHQRADLQQNNPVSVKQEPLPFAMIITPDQFPGRQSNQMISLIKEVSIKVLYVPVQQE